MIDKVSFHERFDSKKGAPRIDHTNALEYGKLNYDEKLIFYIDQ